MDAEKLKTEEFQLEVDSELRFEIETRNRKVVVEVSVKRGLINLLLLFTNCKPLSVFIAVTFLFIVERRTS